MTRSMLLSVLLLAACGQAESNLLDAAATPAPTAIADKDTSVPTSLATPTPTATAPTAMPPTEIPTVAPTAVPTAEPTVAPTAVPTAEPTVAPTAVPTAEPTVAPTAVPTAEPTAVPTATPSPIPDVSQFTCKIYKHFEGQGGAYDVANVQVEYRYAAQFGIQYSDIIVYFLPNNVNYDEVALRTQFKAQLKSATALSDSVRVSYDPDGVSDGGWVEAKWTGSNTWMLRLNTNGQIIEQNFIGQQCNSQIVY